MFRRHLTKMFRRGCGLSNTSPRYQQKMFQRCFFNNYEMFHQTTHKNLKIGYKHFLDTFKIFVFTELSKLKV